MAFRFDFGGAEEEDEPQAGAMEHAKGSLDPQVKSRRVYPAGVKWEESELDHVSVPGSEQRFRKRVFLGTKTGLANLVHNSDLVPSKYEGGFKVWECSIDVIQFLQETKLSLKGQRVLDLGCGHGLPGVYAMQNGAHQAVFQDLNEEVLENCTAPNIALNTDCSLEKLSQPDCPARLFAGDWCDDALVNMLLEGPKAYDIVLTSDTLYSLDSLPVLYSLLKRVTAKPHGKVFVAAKRHYFGVGGSTAALLELLKADQASGGEHMIGQVARVWEDGKSQLRELIVLSWPLQN